jgi:hypothetical protein
MLSIQFEIAIQSVKQLQTYALDRSVTGIDTFSLAAFQLAVGL